MGLRKCLEYENMSVFSVTSKLTIKSRFEISEWLEIKCSK